MFGSRRSDGRRELRSERSVAIARHGMVATSQALASSAGLAVLRSGGNAIDAAVAAVAVQSVVEPYSTGVGGDCLALLWSARERKLVGLNGSGAAPAGASIETLYARGHRAMPLLGIDSVTVPGAVDAWCALLDRFGSRGLAELLEPAIHHAEHGFPVSEVIAREWGLVVRGGMLQNDAARRCFAPGGEPPRVGQVVRFPDLARTLRAIAAGGRDAFYRGEIAKRLVACATEQGGPLSKADLAAHRSAWVDPIGTAYRGVGVYELPPNTQGLAALIGLNLLDCFDGDILAGGGAAEAHLRIEAVKLALADRNRWIADPEHARVPVAELLSKEYARARAGAIDLRRASPDPRPGGPFPGSDTVYLAAADREGNVVSLISSLFGPFGSGLVAAGTGVSLQNRGAGFVLDPSHPNALAPGKRPLHTIIPGMLFRDGRPLGAFGVMGGHIQAQAHVQVVSNLVDRELNVQEAIDRLRFHVLDAAGVAFEPGTDEALVRELAAMGHSVEDPVMALARGGWGGGQGILIDPETGAYWGGSDRRKDGCAIGY